MVVTTTTDDRRKASKLAGLIVDERLAACVQITPIHSVYRWKGRVEKADELLLVAKTPARLAPRLMRFIRRHHTYELPEITVMPIAGGLAPYLDWIRDETTAAPVPRRPSP